MGKPHSKQTKLSVSEKGMEIQQFRLEGGSYSQGLGEILQRCTELEKLPTRHCSQAGETDLGSAILNTSTNRKEDTGYVLEELAKT